MKLNIHSISGNDLAVSFNCECPSKTFKDSPIAHLMKTKINLYGYNDSNFFVNVNKEPRPFKCGCGKEYQQQWFSEGHVIVEELTK